MASIKLRAFGGVVEKLSADLLSDTLSPAAVNARLDSGKLAPFKQNTQVSTLFLAAPTSVYKYPGNNWFEWTEDVDVGKTPIAYDTTDTVLFTGQDYPRITRNDIGLGAGRLPNASYRLGIPSPASAPTIAELTPSADPDALEEDRYYIYTYVDAWGREGAPSFASARLTTKDASTVRITMAATPSGNHNFGTGALRRIYRSNTGSSATAFQFVAEVPIATTIYDDSILNEALAEVIPSTEWVGPPDDDSALYPTGPMVGLCALPNGVFAGFSGNTLCFSVPYVPHAWPMAYRFPLPDAIVALVPSATGLVVLTTGAPQIAIGTDPTAIVLQRIDETQACLSKRSAVDMGDYALYASPDGLMAVEGAGVTNLTSGILTQEQWQAYAPSELRAFRYEGKYLAFNDTAGFIFTPGQDIDAAFMPLSFTAVGGYFDPSSDTLYLLNGPAVDSFNTGAARSYSWQSREFVQPHYVSFSHIRVAASAYPVTVNVIVDGVSTPISVTSAIPQILPVLDGQVWSLEVDTTTAVVSEVVIGTSMKETTRG